MRQDGVVVPPAFDDNLGLSQGVEDLTVEQLIALACIEAVDVAVLLRIAGLNNSDLSADHGDPFLSVPKTSSGDDLGLRRQNSLIVRRISLFR
jgi:hypothetical protein